MKKVNKPRAVTWEEIAAFGDTGELDHVCDMLRDEAALDPSSRINNPEYMTGERSHLVRQLNVQARKTEEMLEAAKPGRYPETWMAKLFFTLFVRLDELTHNPDKLSSNIDWLCVALHKVLIAAHEVFDPHHRAALVANAVSTGASAAAAKSHAGRDALRKAACEKFMERESWASINEAADKIALELVKCKNVSRPLASNNAVRTVSEWVSKFIASNPKAKAHLTAAGQRRLKKK